MPKKSAAEVAFEALPQEQRVLVEPVFRLVEAFKSENDAALEAKADDALTTEKLTKATADIDALKTAVNEAIAKFGASKKGDAEAERKERIVALMKQEHAAIGRFIRTGDMSGLVAAQKDGVKLEGELSLKDLSTVVFEDGGALVHPEVEARMIEVIEDFSPMDQLCDSIEAESGEVELPVDMGGWEAVGIDELGTRSVTDTGTVAMRKFSAEELYARPRVTQRFLEDAKGIDVESWLYRKATKALARTRGKWVIKGNGNKQAKGILSQDIVANSAWAWGKLGYIATGKADGFLPGLPGNQVGGTPGQNGADCLLDLIYAIPQELRGNGHFVMNTKTLGSVRKMKDGDGNYIWRDALTESGIITKILSHPVAEMDHMPDIAANAYPIAYGDFEEGYLIVNRTGLMVKRDDLTQPGFVIVYFRQRFGGDVQNYQAIKLLKVAAS